MLVPKLRNSMAQPAGASLTETSAKGRTTTGALASSRRFSGKIAPNAGKMPALQWLSQRSLTLLLWRFQPKSRKWNSRKKRK
jgi:hypothetical protein